MELAFPVNLMRIIGPHCTNFVIILCVHSKKVIKNRQKTVYLLR